MGGGLRSRPRCFYFREAAESILIPRTPGKLLRLYPSLPHGQAGVRAGREEGGVRAEAAGIVSVVWGVLLKRVCSRRVREGSSLWLSVKGAVGAHGQGARPRPPSLELTPQLGSRCRPLTSGLARRSEPKRARDKELISPLEIKAKSPPQSYVSDALGVPGLN